MRTPRIAFSVNDATDTVIYTLSLHDALPISTDGGAQGALAKRQVAITRGEQVERVIQPLQQHGRFENARAGCGKLKRQRRSEEHTSELQSQSNLVCRLLLEKKNNKKRRL